MQKMGFADQPYIVFKHTDTGRDHLHIVSVRVKKNGTPISIYKDWERSKAICEEFEKKYNLTPSTKNEYSQRDNLKAVDYMAGNLKDQIRNVVRPVMQSYRFQSLKEYKALLSKFNVHVEEVRKEVDGKTRFGIIYTALDKGGNRQGVAIKSSSIGRDVGGKALLRKYKNSKEHFSKNPVPQMTRDWIQQAIRTSFDRREFEDNLRAGNIEAVMFQNQDTGKIYGVTYIDHNSKCVFKGSMLGKEFSASVLDQAFGTGATYSEPAMPDFEQTFGSQYEKGFIEGLFDILTPGEGSIADDYMAEAQLRKLLKKKKKKKKGLSI